VRVARKRAHVQERKKLGQNLGENMIVYDKDDPKFANDLSFMTEQDWLEYEQRRKEREYVASNLSEERQP